MKYVSSLIVRQFAHIAALLLAAVCVFSFTSSICAQTDNSPFPSLQTPDSQPKAPPLTNQEFVRLLYQLPAHPDLRDKLVEEIRTRGLGFPVTEGLRSLVATKSGNDALLRHTLEEADRRRSNPTVAKLPPAAEAAELLERTRKATLGAAATMPDYLVKQQITRSHAMGQTSNWSVYDRLSIAVSYRETAGEDYKLLSVNGMPPGEDQTFGMKLGGTTSTGEYVTVLSELFKPESQAEFNAVDTDMVRGRPTIVYEYVVKKEFSHQVLAWGDKGSVDLETTAGYRGRMWVDRETNRILRLELNSTEIDPGFPITAASRVIDYEWVTINEKQHLLPSHAVVELTSRAQGRTEQTRNDILFRGYRKFGTDLKILDVDDSDFPPDKPEANDPKQPVTPPVLKPQPKKP